MIKLIFLAIAAAVIVLFLGGFSEQDPEEVRYCEMVQLWKEQKKSGVPINDRAGWPPYRGECQ